VSTRITIRNAVLAATLAAAPLAAQGTQRGARTSQPPTRDVAFTATDIGLTGPDSVAADLVNVKLVNRGHEIHQIRFFLVTTAPRTAREAVDSLRQSGRLPGWLNLPAGGVGPVAPGQTGVVIQRLQPGQYVVLDDLLGHDAVVWARKGLARALVVRGSASNVQPMVTASAGLLVGNAFRFGTMLNRRGENVLLEGRNRLSTLHPGDNIIQIENLGASRSIVLLKTDSPTGMRRFSQWLETGAGDPGGAIAGGVPNSRIGGRVYLRVRMEHGTYFIFCPQTNPQTRLRGFETGEFAQFIVR
jgi:hypothetical protein